MRPFKILCWAFIGSALILISLNFLWLAGVLSRPTDEVMGTRWTYAICAVLTGFACYQISRETE